jgi:hypothetical protein
MSINLHLDFANYWNLLLMLLGWNLGFFAITRKGKLLQFILAFFEQKKSVEKKVVGEQYNRLYEALRKDFLIATEYHSKDRKAFITQMESAISVILSKDNYYIYLSVEELILKLDVKNQIDIYFTARVDRFPDLLKDPIVCCITCMASVHGLIIYTSYSIFYHHPWNPFEWVLVAVPCAFLGELLWKLKVLVEKGIEKLKTA